MKFGLQIDDAITHAYHRDTEDTELLFFSAFSVIFIKK